MCFYEYEWCGRVSCLASSLCQSQGVPGSPCGGPPSSSFYWSQHYCSASWYRRGTRDFWGGGGGGVCPRWRPLSHLLILPEDTLCPGVAGCSSKWSSGRYSKVIGGGTLELNTVLLYVSLTRTDHMRGGEEVRSGRRPSERPK